MVFLLFFMHIRQLFYIEKGGLYSTLQNITILTMVHIFIDPLHFYLVL